MSVEDDEDIQKCEVLCAAKLIEAKLPNISPPGEQTAYLGRATVICVTPRGMAASEVRARMPEDSANFYPRTRKSN